MAILEVKQLTKIYGTKKNGTRSVARYQYVY
ncbi:hypothetical protein Y000_01255 [Staphylococcus aureus MUF168]|nr:hypothetical protein Y000_01255 [Staphylococcus aureus MUF168]